MRATTMVGAVFLAAGCAHAPPEVLDADYGRLKPDQTVAVDVARADLARAHEDLAAAKSKIAEASREEELAQTDLAAAKMETERVKKLVEATEARRRAADARGEYAKALNAARKAAEEAAQRRVDLTGAKVELLKLQALEQAKVQASKPYDDKVFYRRVAESQKSFDDAQAEAKKLDEEALQGQRRWDDLMRKAPAAVQ